jgi:2-dehydropantoate 2-reductase
MTLILWGVSRSRFRETLGNSAEECRGLIDLLTAEARPVPALRKAVDALLALRPDETGSLPAPSARA